MIVTTKLQIPHTRHSLVARPRLMAKLNEGMNAKLTLASAQAGYGKTTMLSQWARQCGIHVAWVSLDQQDNDWIQFWSNIIASIREKVPGFGTQVEARLEKGPSATSLSSEPAIKELLNELNQWSGEMAIVLDDYHFIDMASIHDSLSYLLEHLPPQIHLYIASRTELNIPTARLRANGQMQQINMQDLRFELDEGLGFFERKRDLLLTKEQVTEVLRQTEGWISGVQLASISLKRSSNIADSIQQFSGKQHHIADYLLEEVFQYLTETMQAFLLETSILTRMNSSLCEAVTGQVDSQELLVRLEQLNLFIIPLDDERNWYRYHHLLSDFLQHILSSGDTDKWVQAHTKAARWLERHGFVEEAAEHYLKGRQYDDVVRLIENHLDAFIYKKSATLSRWILQVPESFLSKNPMVEMFYLLLMIGMGDWGTAAKKIELAKIRYEALQEQMDGAAWKQIMGNIYFLCATSCYFQKDLKQLSEYFELVERFTPEGCFFQTIGNNKYNSGFEEFEDHLAIINDYHTVAEFLLKWITRWEHNKAHSFVGRLYASYSKLLYEWNRLEESENYIRQVLCPDITHNTRSMVQIYLIASQIQQAQGNHALAVELLEQLKVQIDSPDYKWFLRKIEAEQASLAVRQGDNSYALEWLERCSIAPADEVSLNGVSEYLALARVLAACGRVKEALDLLERLHRLFFKENRLRDRIKTLVLQSVILHRIGQTEEALVRLKTALHLAEPEGFIRSFVDEGSVMAELLPACRPQQNSRASSAVAISQAYVERLLQAMNVTSGTAMKSLVKAQCFGRFRLFTERSDGAEIKWRTSKAEELMAYLVHHRGEAIDRHSILEDIWGNWDVDKAAAQLNLTVHYIRKSLRSVGVEGLLRHARGLYKIDADRIDCDYYEFETRTTVGSRLNNNNIEKCEQIAALYKGGYMEGNGYAWASQTTRNLEQEYVDLLMHIQDYYASGGNFRQAVKTLTKALSYTPWNEDIHTRLIEVYLLSSDRIAAIKQYEVLRKMLKTEYNVAPGEAVKRLMAIK
ncbi:BTAD domain-containing putative transcriptional regulator [Sulfoacidibacillus ferrooxidans]|uniref:HTH-type transcriptional regulator MalT n=1 Tax=Sulfoacidibacillus ferrooxidans TaxID=2005001 RepID=A0A9X2ADC5_9BACL|nr:BTAD domain-containing putative transcriptional regulator [Sulfoacidibacillus ferrooxidans]MCI0184764.1 HTH-type transcriptional regulator MalT [Sulfoacidibacillus ferrooxidans]